MRRHGLSTVVLAVVLLALMAVSGFVQAWLSHQTLDQVHHGELAGLARAEAASAIEEMLEQISVDANEPGTVVFRQIRETMDEKWEHQELTRALKPTRLHVNPTWSRTGEREGRGIRGTVLAAHAWIRATRSAYDVGGSEEWVGLLDLGVTAQMSDALGAVRQDLESTFEIRTVLAGAPRPFDQMGLFLGKLSVVTDARAANRFRTDLLKRQETLRHQAQEAGNIALPPKAAADLAELMKTMRPSDLVVKRTPELPEEPSALWGFYGKEVKLDQLDLAATLSRMEPGIREAEAALASRRNDPEHVVESLVAVDHAYSDALNAMWAYQRLYHVAGLKSSSFASIGSFLPRLTPEFFRNRAHLVMTPADPIWQEWSGGKGRLEGVVDLTAAPAQLTLKGEVNGRVVLLVGQHGAALESLNVVGSSLGNRITVVSLGGDVSLLGEVHASIVMLGSGQLRVPSQSVCVGQILCPDPSAANLRLEGTLRYNPELYTPYPPRETLERVGRGDYVVGISPTPLFSTGSLR